MNAADFFVRQAKILGDSAFRTLHPLNPDKPDEAYARGAELYRRAIHFGLAAHAAASANTELAGGVEPEAGGEPQLPELAVLLETTPRSTLRQWALTDSHLERCINHLRLDSYAAFTALDQEAQHEVCSDLGAFYRAMMVALLPAESAAEVKRFKRDLGWFALGTLAVLSCIALVKAMYEHKLSTDLTLSATWTISSRYGESCKSPEQECPGGESYFFHTKQEQDPWLMFDFNTSKSFSSIEVVNRLDCCGERANPLVISVSDDKKEWRVVAESRREFTTFDASFPTVSARYLKLQIPLPGAMLHLSRVRVFP